MKGQTLPAALLAAALLGGPVHAQAPKPAGAPSAAPAAPAPGPFCADPEHRQFDFWLGTWDVTSTDGKHLGTNEVTSILGNCALEEHWRGDRGVVGTSLNTYSDDDHQWHQTWATDRGAFFQLAGGLSGPGKMVMSREIVDEGRKLLQRWSWEKVADDRLIQRSELSEDGGKTWKAGFTGIYNRRKP